MSTITKAILTNPGCIFLFWVQIARERRGPQHFCWLLKRMLRSLGVMSLNSEGERMWDNSTTGGEGESQREKVKRSHTVCGEIWSANGSRKRILILILHTQILLYSPSGLCYSTFRRQKPSTSHISDPSRPRSCASPASLLGGFSCHRFIARRIAPRGGGRRLRLYRADLDAPLSREQSSRRPDVWGVKQKVRVCGDFPWIWLLSGVVSMQTSISSCSGKIEKPVLVFQTACVILDEATMLNVLLVCTGAGGSAVEFIYQTSFTCGVGRRF